MLANESERVQDDPTNDVRLSPTGFPADADLFMAEVLSERETAEPTLDEETAHYEAWLAACGEQAQTGMVA